MWTILAFWSGLLKNVIGATRARQERKSSASFLIVDAQSQQLLRLYQ